MSVSCLDCFSDLLCDEDSSEILSEQSPGNSTELESPPYIEESIAGFIENETQLLEEDCLSGFQSQWLEASSRAESVAWILKIQDHYGLQPVTAYLSVNYLDRFLYSRRLPQTNGWPMQLLSVACLSLAAKMEETLLPSLLDLQVEGAKYIFEPKTIFKMELLVLRVLEWRLRSITPFSFISFFACKLDPSATFMGFLMSRAKEIILSNIGEASFLVFRPSCMAVAALLCAANEIPNLSRENPEEAEMWCKGLRKEKIIGCYRLMQEFLHNRRRSTPPKIIPQLRLTTIPTSFRSDDSSSSSSSSLSSSLSSSSTTSSSSSVFSSPHKRRKLANC